MLRKGQTRFSCLIPFAFLPRATFYPAQQIFTLTLPVTRKFANKRLPRPVLSLIHGNSSQKCVPVCKNNAITLVFNFNGREMLHIRVRFEKRWRCRRVSGLSRAEKQFLKLTATLNARLRNTRLWRMMY